MDGLMQKWPLVVSSIIDYAAKYHGEQEVVTRRSDGDVRVSTYRDLHRRARLCALALRSLGVRCGDVVATMAWNTSEHLECWYGIMGLGAVCHTLNPRLFEKDLEYIINHAGDVVLMVDPMFVSLMELLAPRLPHVRAFVILTDDRGMPKRSQLRDMYCYETLLEEEVGHLSVFEWEVVDENSAAGLCYTSGTTGKPKGVMYSHRSNYLHSLITCQADVVPLASSSCMLMIVPMFHANSWGLAFQGPLTGAKLVLPGPNLDGDSVYRLLEEQCVTVTAAVPTVLLGLLEHLRSKHLKLHHLQTIVVGGAACPGSMMEAYEEEFGVEVRHMWGMTELSPVGTAGGLKGALGPLRGPEARAVKLKQGRSHVFCQMRVVDDCGNELPWDGKSVGNLQVRGPTVLSRYFKADKPATDAEGWFDTGDVGCLDPLGHMQITDRSKDVIKSGGEWISSIEIENCAVGHPGVAEAAVIGIPHAKWTERPLLIVVPSKQVQPPSAQELLSFLRGHLASWWLPDDVLFVAELPHTSTGKISKMELRRKFGNHKPQQPRL